MLLGRLIERMRRALSLKHLTDSEHGPKIADHRVFVAELNCGTMLMTVNSRFWLSMVARSAGTSLAVY